MSDQAYASAKGCKLNTAQNFPLGVFIFSFVALWLSVHIGALFARKLRSKEGERDDLSLVMNASLTLLALIIGFSFSMAVTRYDQRKNYEEEEANAIGTEYVRADLLPAADAVRVRQMLMEYLDQRLLFYTVRDPRRLESVNNNTEKLQAEMWSTVQSAASVQPTPPIALAVAGMNDVLNSQGYSQAAWWNQIPVGAWILMMVLAICCCVLTGYSVRRTGIVLFTFLPLFISIAFFLIADIDSPRRGVIRVAPRNLISLSHSLNIH